MTIAPGLPVWNMPNMQNRALLCTIKSHGTTMAANFQAIGVFSKWVDGCPVGRIANPSYCLTEQCFIKQRNAEQMDNILFMAHSGWRWLVVLVGLIFLVKMAWGWLGKGQWSKLDRQLGLATTIVVDMQVLFGLILWIERQAWARGDFRASWEHPITMLLGLVIMHIGWSRARKADSDQGKFRQAFIWLLVAALIIGSGIAQATMLV